MKPQAKERSRKMKISFGVELAEKHWHGQPKAWKRIALALALVWSAGVGSALAASFGAFGLVTIYDPGANENPDDFFAMDPASATLPLVLIPESPVYTNGATSAAISMSRLIILSGSGSGNASADLAAGRLRAYSTASSLPNAGVNVYARTGFADTLTPLANGTIHFDFIVNGTITGGNAGGGGWFAIDGSVLYGTRGEVDACLDSLTSSCTFSVDVVVTAGVPFQFSAAIEAGASNGTADLANTATLFASGVAFVSDSGVFLTAVPEPASLLLLGIGWAGTAWRRGPRTSAD